MDKISITIDVSKISKDKIVTRSFKNREGDEMTSKDYKLEVIPLTKPKLIKEGDGWQMLKTHFVIEALTKEEKAAEVKAISLGDGITFKSTRNLPGEELVNN